MAKRGRPRKVHKTQGLVDVSGAPAWFQKPQWIAGKWRACRIERGSGARKWVTVEPPEGETFKKSETDQLKARDLILALAIREKAEAEVQQAAEDARLAQEEARRLGAYIETGNDKLRPAGVLAAMEAWFKYRADTGCGADTVYNEKSMFLLHAVKGWGAETPVHSIEPRHVRDVMTTGDMPTLVISTRLKFLALLGGFFAWCEEGGLCTGNPARKWTVPAGWKKEARDHRRTTVKVALRVEEVRMLLEVAREGVVATVSDFKRVRKGKTEHVHMVYRLPKALHTATAIGVLTGLRRGNVLGLCWGEVDLTEGAERIQIAADKMKAGVEFDCPMNAELAVLLRSVRRSLGRVPRPDELVLKGLGGFTKVWHRLVAKIKERYPEDFNSKFHRFHDLRTTFCSMLCGTNGLVAESVTVRRLRGDVLNSTAESYSRDLDPRILREAVNRLPRLLETEITVSTKKLACI